MAVRLYLDASVLVAMFTNDVLSARADAMLRAGPAELVLSDFAAAEFASALARRVRMGRLAGDDARAAFASLDGWSARAVWRVETVAADVRAAEAVLRRLELTLRTPDALHIAVAQRVGAVLATFDSGMAAAARALGSEVVG